MAKADSLSTIHFAAAQQRKFDFPTHALPDFYNNFHDLQPIKSDLNPARLFGHSWTAPGFALLNVQNAASVVERSRNKSENGAHLLSIQRYSGGRVHGFLDDLNVDRFPGNIYVFDLERRVKCVQFPNTAQFVLIPKSAIGYDPDKHPPLMSFPTHSPIGALLDAQLVTMFDQALSTNAVDSFAFEQLIALLKVGILSDDQDESVRRLARDSLRAMIQTHIEQNLTSPGLSVASILRVFGLSRASLFRMFETHGGVRKYIHDRRIFGAVLDLSKRPLPRGAIGRAAERWGFSSQANFNRSVHRIFGTSPGSLVNSNLPTLTPEETLRSRLY